MADQGAQAESAAIAFESDSETIAKIFKGGETKAAELKEKQMAFMLADEDGMVFAQHRIAGTGSVGFKFAKGKIKSLAPLAQGKATRPPDQKMCKIVCCLLPRFFCCGAAMPVRGAVVFQSGAKRYIASASGSPDPQKDEECMIAGLQAAGIEVI